MPDTPLTSFRIALTNLKSRVGRTSGLVLVVALFSFVLFGGSMLAANIRNGIHSMTERLGADLVIVPKKNDSQFEGVLLRGEPSSFYLEKDISPELRSIPGVAAVSSQLFIASLDSSCCSAKVQLVGFDRDTDFVIQPWLEAGAHGGLVEGDIIVGHRIFGEIGEKINFFNRPFKIAGILEKTGTGFDTSVFMGMETAKSLLSTGASPERLTEGNPVASAVLIKTAEGYDPAAVSYEILTKYGKTFDIKVIVAKSFISGIAGKLKTIIWIVYGVASILWLLAVTVLFLVFSISFNERKREFSVLRVLGATHRKLISIIMAESLLISVVGALAGTLVAAIIIFPFNTLISVAAGLPYLLPSAAIIAGIVAGSLAMASLTGPLACLGIARRISRPDAYSLMRETE